LLVGALTLGACSGDDGGEAVADEGVNLDSGGVATSAADTGADDTGAPGSATDSADDGPSADTMSVDDGPDDPGDPPIVFDLGALPDAPELTSACSKVDFLFVIDNSGSMSTYQQRLIDNFPVFINGIQDSLDDVMTYQVGVVTTDNYTPNAAGCNGLPSLVVQTGGSNSSNAVCGPYNEGFNFMTEQDDLSSSFSCAAQIGSSGSGLELTMQAVEGAVTKTEGGIGQCNEGFIRDDALLVIVIITDEADGPGDPDGAPGTGTSLGDPTSWFEAIVAAKMGIPENIVVLSLINYAGGSCPPVFPFEDGQNIADFTTMFGANGFLGGICELDYEPMFTQAVGVIDEACENFVAPS